MAVQPWQRVRATKLVQLWLAVVTSSPIQKVSWVPSTWLIPVLQESGFASNIRTLPSIQSHGFKANRVKLIGRGRVSPGAPWTDVLYSCHNSYHYDHILSYIYTVIICSRVEAMAH